MDRRCPCGEICRSGTYDVHVSPDARNCAKRAWTSDATVPCIRACHGCSHAMNGKLGWDEGPPHDELRDRTGLPDGVVFGADQRAPPRQRQLRRECSANRRGSDVELRPAGHRGSHQATGGYASRMPRMQLPPLPTGWPKAPISAPSVHPSTLARNRHLRIVFLFTPYCRVSSATEACDRCIAARAACLVVAQLCRTCPIGHPSMMDLR